MSIQKNNSSVMSFQIFGILKKLIVNISSSEIKKIGYVNFQVKTVTKSMVGTIS